MVPAGTEMLVGVVHDRLFGPVIACGAGDAEMELLKDVAVRITPLTDRDATEMLRSLAMYPLLEGYRNATRADVAALEQVLLRVSAMVEAHPEIVEMDCNPVIVLPEGAVVVDAPRPDRGAGAPLGHGGAAVAKRERSEIALSMDDLREVARFAAACAQDVLEIFERAHPADTPPDETRSDAARAFARGGRERGKATARHTHGRRSGRPARPNSGGARGEAPAARANAARAAMSAASRCVPAPTGRRATR